MSTREIDLVPRLGDLVQRSRVERRQAIAEALVPGQPADESRLVAEHKR